MSKLSLIGIVILAISICALCFSRCGGSGETGNGKVIKENRPVSPFSKVELDGVFKTVISQDGGPEWVKVETDQNLQHTIEIKNDGETLVIGSSKKFHFSAPSKMIVYVNVKNISSLSNQSVGAVETQGIIRADELDLQNKAVGKFSFNMEVRKLTASLSAVGETLLTGTATDAEINNKSVGKLDADGLKVDVLTISNSAVGKVEVYAEKEISIDHTGVGRFNYRGPATVKHLNDGGVGKVSKTE